MRKHNKAFATRWGREKTREGVAKGKPSKIVDRSNFPQSMAHSFVNNKAAQFAANFLLQVLLQPFMPKRKESQ